jgi:hypothetical protein
MGFARYQQRVGATRTAKAGDPVSETENYAQELHWLLAEVLVCLHDLDDERIKWRPGSSSANDVATTVSHLTGSMRAYALGLGCGLPVERDRPAEFEAVNRTLAQLVEAVEALDAEIASAFANVRDSELDEPIAPPSPAWIGTEPPEGERRHAIVEAIRHAGVHLGEIRLTHDLALAAEGREP